MIEEKWEKADFIMAHELQKVMGTPVWQFLKRYWVLQREAILMSMKKAKAEDSIYEKVGQLKGFDYAISIPEKIVKEMERQVKDNQPEPPEEAYADSPS